MRNRLTEGNLPAFFGDIVHGLHEKGVFQDYDEPKGPAVDMDRHLRYKLTHYSDHTKNTPGLRYHLGDQPFDATVSGVAFNDSTVASPMQPSQREMLDKTRSIQEAIKHYVPQDKFASYLRYFAENLHNPRNRELLDESFANMSEQLGFIVNMREEFQLDVEELDTFVNSQTTQSRLENMGEVIKRQEEYYYKLPDGSPNRTAAMRAVGVVRGSKSLNFAPEFPELLLTLAIFQAAHIGYRKELQEAVDEAHDPDEGEPLISRSEHDNATSVVQESLRQFDAFLIFSGMLPLVIHEHEKLARVPGPPMAEEEQVRQSITNGWRTFFKAQVLRSDTLSNAASTSEDYEGKRLTMVCPAKPHLRTMQTEGVLETIYDSVTTHRDMLQDLIDTAGHHAEMALSGREVAELESIKFRNGNAYQQRIDSRLKDLGLKDDGTPYPVLGDSELLVGKDEAAKLAKAFSSLETALSDQGEFSGYFRNAKKILEKYVAAQEVKQHGPNIILITNSDASPDEQEETYCDLNDFSLSHICGQVNSAFTRLEYDGALKAAVEGAIPERAQSQLQFPSHADRLKNKTPRLVEDDCYISKDEVTRFIPALELVAHKAAEHWEMPVGISNLGGKLQAMKDYIAADKVSQSGKKVTFTRGSEEQQHLVSNFDLEEIKQAVEHALKSIPDGAELRKAVDAVMPDRNKQKSAATQVEKLAQRAQANSEVGLG